MSVDDDIQKLREYILLAERLQDRIEAQGTKRIVEKLSDTLRSTMISYTNERKSEQELQRKLEEFYKYFDSREQAEKYLQAGAKIPPPSRYAPVINSAASVLFGFAACFAACFSREISKTFLRKKDIYRKISDNSSKRLKLEKETERINNKTMRTLSQNEFAAARLIDQMRERVYIDDDAAYRITKQPELLVYALLDNIRQKYAPDMEE